MNPTKVKYFCIHSFPTVVFKTDAIEPLQTGAEVSNFNLQMQKDNTGDNISVKNTFYGELTGHYWVWKNYLPTAIETEYIGFCHYRRILDFTKKANTNRCFNYVITNRNFLKRINNYSSDAIYKVVKDYDIILPEIEIFKERTVNSQFTTFHGQKDISIVKDLIVNMYPDYTEEMNLYFDGYSSYLCLNFMMKTSLFAEYMDWIFDILLQLENVSAIEKDTGKYQQRMAAFLSERLFNVWARHQITTRKLKVLHRKSNVIYPPIEGSFTTKAISILSLIKNKFENFIEIIKFKLNKSNQY